MQRDTLKQSGDAFADYAAAGYSGTFRVFAYDGRGELQTDVRYRGDTPTTAPAATDELPARRFEYRYDEIGNRKTSGSTGSANTADDEYTPNALNQYTARENNTVKVLGLASTAATVAVRDAPSTTKKDHAWGADLLPANGNGPVAGTATVYAALPGAGTGGADIIRADTRPYTVPAAVQAFSYDEDGNLTSDGVWSYQWDAENRLKQMTTTSAASAGGLAARTLTFQYDYMDRRVQKRVVDGAGAELSSRRYLYDGWNLVAEFALNTQLSTLNLVRSYTWGLDLVGSRTATGGVGALLQIADHASGKNYLPTYDSNGNIAALLNASTGDPAAIYEYGPFGEILRATINDATVADNPWQFSTKFTDGETGLVYYGHRYYSATLGRFINRDPVEESGGVNLYGFCANDPVDNYDVLGNEPVFSDSVARLKKHNQDALELTDAVRGSLISGQPIPMKIFENMAEGAAGDLRSDGARMMAAVRSRNGGNGSNGTTIITSKATERGGRYDASRDLWVDPSGRTHSFSVSFGEMKYGETFADIPVPTSSAPLRDFWADATAQQRREAFFSSHQTARPSDWSMVVRSSEQYSDSLLFGAALFEQYAWLGVPGGSAIEMGEGLLAIGSLAKTGFAALKNLAAAENAAVQGTRAGAGVYTGSMNVAGKVATYEVGVVVGDSGTILSGLRTVTAQARAAGAESLVINTGHVVNEQLAASLMARAQSGATMFGGTVEVAYQGAASPIFKITIPIK